MPISAVDAIPLAFQHTKQQLLQPFRLGQWTRLALVGLLAGELGSGGGFRGTNLFSKHPGTSPHPGTFGLGLDPALLAAFIAVAVVAALVVGLILMYIGSVMRFILFDSVLTKECHIRQGWMRRQGAGWRYFLWQLFYLLAMGAGFFLLIVIPAGFAFALGWFNQPKNHLLPLILGGILLFFLIVIFVASMSVVYVLTKDFVVPQMALENVNAIEGWRRLWAMIRSETGAYAGYIGMKIVMAIGAGIVIGITTLILGLIVAIPTAALSILAVLTGKTAGLTWNAYTITLAIVVGMVLLAGFLYLIALISVPVIVFFPAYSIYFLASRYPALSAALYPPAPLMSPAFSAPEQPPPLPPAPEPIG